MDSRTRQALVALRRILKVTELSSRQLASRGNVNTSQLLVLQLLAEQGKTLPSVIARTVNLKQATVSVLLHKMQDSGLVSREKDSKDRRRHWVALTDAGRTALETAPDLLQHRFKRGFSELQDWEQSMLVAALDRVAALLDAENLDAAPVLEIGDLDRVASD